MGSHGDKPCGGHGSGNGMLSESMHGVGSGGYSKVDDDDDDEFEAVDATNVNMWQLYLHLVGDVLGALFIIAEGLICYFWEDDHWTVFIDPIFSLIIVGIILAPCERRGHRHRSHSHIPFRRRVDGDAEPD